MTTERRRGGALSSFTEKFRFPIWKIDRDFAFRIGCCSTVLAKANGKKRFLFTSKGSFRLGSIDRSGQSSFLLYCRDMNRNGSSAKSINAADMARLGL